MERQRSTKGVEKVSTCEQARAVYFMTSPFFSVRHGLHIGGVFFLLQRSLEPLDDDSAKHTAQLPI